MLQEINYHYLPMSEPKGNLFNLPIEQKFLIVAFSLSTEYLAKIARENRPPDILIDANWEFVFQRLGEEYPSEAKIDFFLKDFLKHHNL